MSQLYDFVYDVNKYTHAAEVVSASPEIPRILYNPTVLYRISATCPYPEGSQFSLF
jgi:hypothetical protein